MDLKKEHKKGASLSQEAVRDYLQAVAERGRTDDTLKNYRRSLDKFSSWLPEGTELDKNTLVRYEKDLLEQGYAPGYVHMLCSAVKGFLSYLEEGELPLVSRLPLEDAGVQPELTRKEYLRLLSAAKAANRECAYMLVKLFATTGIAVRELPRVTVEAVKQQRIVTFPNRVRQEIRIPSCVQKELLDFARWSNIPEGPLFRSRNGGVLHRASVTAIIQRLAPLARVDQDKCNPRCLRKLYMATMENMRQNVEILLRMTYDNLLEQEQTACGWEDVQRRG